MRPTTALTESLLRLVVSDRFSLVYLIHSFRFISFHFISWIGILKSPTHIFSTCFLFSTFFPCSLPLASPRLAASAPLRTTQQPSPTSGPTRSKFEPKAEPDLEDEELPKTRAQDRRIRFSSFSFLFLDSMCF